ncbi:hypothetical protein BsWGS_23300 [Bradybaena similaris]
MKLLSHLYIVLVAVVEEVSPDQWNCAYEGCECYRGGIDCQGRNWKTLPKLLGYQTEESPSLNLQNNLLTAIGAGSLPSGLSGINFQNNPLTFIDPTAFDGSADSLRQLEFTGALFTQIPTALAHLTTLMSLSIEDTHISVWDDDTMKHLGPTVLYLTLNNVSLASWPGWIQYYTNLQRLEMTSTFTSIPNNAFDSQANSLNTLQLVNGVLSEIPPISSLSVLTSLVLDYNNITKLTALPSYGKLSSISIQYNNLSNATHLSHVFKSVSASLTYIQAEGNKLTTFPDLSFMTKLQTVYLSHNLIADTTSGGISSSLTFLEAENNNIRSLSGFLKGGINLQYLRLGMNFIASLSGNDIPANINELEMSKNLIYELTDTSFPTRTLMDALTLDYNPIFKISPSSFTGLTNLRTLSLKGTKLTRLPVALRSLTGLYTLDMSENSDLVCTCLDKQLRSWYLNNSLSSFGECGPTTIDYFLNTLSVSCP